MKDKKVVGIIIFVLLVVAIIGLKFFTDSKEENNTSGESKNGLTTIYVATGGGKENFLNDERVIEILNKKYKLNVVFDSWSNGKTILWPLVREAIGKGDGVDKYDKDTSTINTSGLTKYDALFASDQRFYDYYQLSADKSKGEADRYRTLGGSQTLNTPIVIYSWKDVSEALERENIVTVRDGVHYITDMPKLMQYIQEGKKWKDIGLDLLYGSINIASTDPVTSSPGATYYGLLLAILCDGEVTSEKLNDALPTLATFYKKSGYMNNTPADLFERYLRMGMGSYPMIVDYEKSLIDFANAYPQKYEELSSDVVILYPAPTIWNSHCYQYFTENGKLLYDALSNDEELQSIAWEKYGFRTGISGGNYDVSKLGLGIPKSISTTVKSLKMDEYNKLIEYLEKVFNEDEDSVQ